MDEILESLLKRVDRPYDIPLNVAIWISFKPIIKIYLSIGAGFLLARTNILTPELSKGISRLVLLIFMPCLIFNNIVSQIKDTDIKIFGVIVFTGFIYYLIGLGWGFIIKLVSPIPRAWFGGLLLCCMLNNCSDLPLAYVQTIGNSPLLPSDVAARGVSYCVLIVIVFTIFSFNLGGTRLVEWDATREDPKREEPTVPLISWESTKNTYKKAIRKVHPSHNNEQEENCESNKPVNASTNTNKFQSDLEAQCGDSQSFTDHEDHIPYNEMDHMDYLGRMESSRSQLRARMERPFGSTDVFYARTPRGSFVAVESFDDARSSFADPNSPVAYHNMARNLARSRPEARDAVSLRSSDSTDQVSSLSRHKSEQNNYSNKKNKNAFTNFWDRFKRHWFHFKSKNHITTYICNFCEDIFLPQMMALLAGITVAMIPWVRRVFVKGQHISNFHDAPDKMPPLSFLMDFLSFFAGAQVPLGLMLLGGTIASLRVGKMVRGFWKSLVLIVLFKLVILPIIACAWIHRIREIGWIEKNDPIVPIVLAVASGTPSATVQIYLTLSWIDPTKESVELNCLALALMAQYALLPITLTFLMTYVVMHFV